MSEQLDAVERKSKRKWFLYVSYAASILILLSLLFLWDKVEVQENIVPEEVYVKENIDTSFFKPKNREFIKSTKEVIVQNEIKRKTKSNLVKQKKLPTTILAKKESTALQKNKLIVKQIVKDSTKQAKPKLENNPSSIQKEIKNVIKPKFDINSSIKVSSDALLYAVTHDKEDVRNYYEKYLISRAEVLKSIEKELKKSNLKIKANIILAEVERDLTEESFQNNFLRTIKKRVSDVATVIAKRND